MLASCVPTYGLVKRPFAGGDLFLDLARSQTQRLLWLNGERVVGERSLLASLLRPGMFVVDVGANIGYYLLMLERSVVHWAV